MSGFGHARSCAFINHLHYGCGFLLLPLRKRYLNEARSRETELLRGTCLCEGAGFAASERCLDLQHKIAAFKAARRIGLVTLMLLD